MKAILAAVFAIFVVFSLDVASAKSDGPKNEGHRLLADEIFATFADAEMFGVLLTNKSDWAERTTADGRVLDLNNQEAMVGSWAVSNVDEACYIYHGAPPHIVCYSIYEADGQILFYESTSNRLVARTTKVVSPKRK